MTVESILDGMRNRPGTGDVIPVFDPVSEEQITEFRDCGAEAVDDAVARARSSFEAGTWVGRPGRERARTLWCIADSMEQRADELAQLDSLNTGMPLSQARFNVLTAAEFFR